MANYSSQNVVIELKDSGGTYRDISQHVRTCNGIDIENLTTETHAFGDSWIENSWTGMSKVNDITLEGIYDDAANTPATLYSRGASRDFRITWGGGKQTYLTTIMAKFSRDPKLGELTHYKMVLKPASSLTEV
jgi:hypothetical protein